MLLTIVRLLVQLVLLEPPAGDQAPGDGPPRPPKQAIEACAGKSAGASCSFSGRDSQTVVGVCFTPAADKPLACKPERPPSDATRGFRPSGPR